MGQDDTTTGQHMALPPTMSVQSGSEQHTAIPSGHMPPPTLYTAQPSVGQLNEKQVQSQFVSRVEQVIAQTTASPRTQAEEIGKLKQAYLESRFGAATLPPQ